MKILPLPLCVDADLIVASARPFRYTETCAVYFLIYEGAIVYVGQTTSLWARLQKNSWGGRKFKYTSASWIEVPRPYLDMVESWYFHKFKPIHTKRVRYQKLDELEQLIKNSKAGFWKNQLTLSPEPSEILDITKSQIHDIM